MKPVLCPCCTRKFAKQETLVRHMNSTHRPRILEVLDKLNRMATAAGQAMLKQDSNGLLAICDCPAEAAMYAARAKATDPANQTNVDLVQNDSTINENKTTNSSDKQEDNSTGTSTNIDINDNIITTNNNDDHDDDKDLVVTNETSLIPSALATTSKQTPANMQKSSKQPSTSISTTSKNNSNNNNKSNSNGNNNNNNNKSSSNVTKIKTEGALKDEKSSIMMTTSNLQEIIC